MRTHEFEYAIYATRKNRVAAGVLAAVLLAVAVAAAGYGLIALASAAKEVLVSVIAAAASLLSAVFAYAFQRAKDVELAAIQKRGELEVAERMTKQANYARILERLAPYVRDPTKSADEFTTAYLHTWVIGSVAVVQSVDAFLKVRNVDSLDQLLHAMRDDLTLESYGSGRALRELTSKGLFPAPPPSPAQQGLQD